MLRILSERNAPGAAERSQFVANDRNPGRDHETNARDRIKFDGKVVNPMSEYLNKKLFEKWLENQYHDQDISHDRARAYQKALRIIQSGAFDADPTEVQRLRAALELAMPIVEHQSPTRAEIIREALSTTEPTGAQKVYNWVPATISPAEGRYIITDGRQIGQGGYYDGQWYADDLAPLMSEDITHYMIIQPPDINAPESTGAERVICEVCEWKKRVAYTCAHCIGINAPEKGDEFE
ncbi:hypothetical protein [Neobacillus sp.]|uniref:hypothetical protein n=1 Tax=Neobacillus sp. TaxID=2675273 RepID=UPI0035B56070